MAGDKDFAVVAGELLKGMLHFAAKFAANDSPGRTRTRANELLSQLPAGRVREWQSGRSFATHGTLLRIEMVPM